MGLEWKGWDVLGGCCVDFIDCGSSAGKCLPRADPCAYGWLLAGDLVSSARGMQEV